jgi:hypothetical protein
MMTGWINIGDEKGIQEKRREKSKDVKDKGREDRNSFPHHL